MLNGLTHLSYPNYGARAARPQSWIEAFAFKLFPAHICAILRNELRMLLLRMRGRRVRRRFRDSRELLVNVGAGGAGQPGWVNVDVAPDEGINCLYDCRKSLPFSDGSVRGIFCEHFLEHLDYTEEAPAFLQECLRVLEPGGVIRVVVPDVEAYLLAYCQPGWSAFQQLGRVGEKREDSFFEGNVYETKMELVDQVCRQGYQHKFSYDYSTVEFLLNRFGYAEINRQTFASSRMPELAIDQEWRASESLYVEAVKR
jgi:predicted SAM-dependent methyltransferase